MTWPARLLWVVAICTAFVVVGIVSEPPPPDVLTQPARAAAPPRGSETFSFRIVLLRSAVASMTETMRLGGDCWVNTPLRIRAGHVSAKQNEVICQESDLP